MMEPYTKSKTSGILYRKIPKGEYSHVYGLRNQRTFVLKDNPKGGYTRELISNQKMQKEIIEDIKKGRWDKKYTLPPYLIELNEEDKGLEPYSWEVVFDSVPDEILNEVHLEYFKPTVRKYMKPDTRERFKDIF